MKIPLIKRVGLFGKNEDRNKFIGGLFHSFSQSRVGILTCQ